jgi:hypothetical protein
MILRIYPRIYSRNTGIGMASMKATAMGVMLSPSHRACLKWAIKSRWQSKFIQLLKLDSSPQTTGSLVPTTDYLPPDVQSSKLALVFSIAAAYSKRAFLRRFACTG